ncbi:hypothetical protein C8R45DRAFT_1163444 [Mycena sanguinolenta]|nr:hypothetical protein C8R45DRAFT_1163444 [Mycena sanguinolenta]
MDLPTSSSRYTTAPPRLHNFLAGSRDPGWPSPCKSYPASTPIPLACSSRSRTLTRSVLTHDAKRTRNVAFFRGYAPRAIDGQARTQLVDVRGWGSLHLTPLTRNQLSWPFIQLVASYELDPTATHKGPERGANLGIKFKGSATRTKAKDAGARSKKKQRKDRAVIRKDEKACRTQRRDGMREERHAMCWKGGRHDVHPAAAANLGNESQHAASYAEQRERRFAVVDIDFGVAVVECCSRVTGSKVAETQADYSLEGFLSTSPFFCTAHANSGFRIRCKSKSLKDELDTIYSSSDSTLNELTPRHATLLHGTGLTLAQLRHSLARSDVAVLPRDDIMYRQVLPIVACLRVVALIAAFLSSRIILGLFLQHNGFGNITGYMQNRNVPVHVVPSAPLAAQAPPPPHLGQQPLFGLPVPTSQLVHPAQMNPGSLLYTRSSDGRFHPHGPLPMVTDSNPIHTPQLSSIHPTRAAQIPLTFSEQIQAAAQTVPGAPNITRMQLETPAVADDEWSPWLDGEFEADFTWKQFADTKQLQVHGSCRVGGGDRKGDEMADYWEAGKRSTRTCQGIITCDVDICSIILRPQTTAQGIAGQLLQRCRCNGRLSHRFCGVKSTLHKWSGGVHYSNLGRHDHPRLTHVLHVSPREQAKFEEIVTAHPGTRALGLIVGVPGIHGPGESVADISSVYLNADRVRKERDKIKRGDTQRGDGFISDFAAFTEAHPDFVVYSQIGTVTVICMQTPFMASQLLKLELIMTGPVNGLVSDAAHGWWLVRTSLLIITSVYCPELFCWVPGIFSYTNGATAAHYECHFYALLESIAHQADLRGIEVTDKLFAGTSVKLSELGSVRHSSDFGVSDPPIHARGSNLKKRLKPFTEGVLNTFARESPGAKKISGVVPPEQAAAFEYRVLALLDAADSEQFQARAAAVIRDFPKTESWLRWWMRESHAVMLFASERKMDPDIWDSIPDSTNPEEALHWKLYCAVGRLHALMEGLRSLYAVAEYYQRLYTGTVAGVPIRYGQAKPWKVISQQIGRTKPSRAPETSSSQRKKNDGRPPDTSAELLGSLKSNKGSSKGPSKPDRLVGYPWANNSCWLDSALELLFSAVTRNFADFSSRFDDINPDSTRFWTLRTLPPSEAVSRHLPAWLAGLFKHLSRDGSSQFELAESFFHSQVVYLRSCTGAIGPGLAKHVQIARRTSQQCVHVLQPYACKKFKHSVQGWLKNEILVNKTPDTLAHCWRSRDSTHFCTGTAQTTSFYVALPAVLIFEVNEVPENDWDFTSTLQIPGSNMGDPEIIYDIVGRAFYSRTKRHYIARYWDADQSAVFTYDGYETGGYSVRESGGKASMKTYLCGCHPDTPSTFITSAVIYHLRGGLDAQEGFEASQMVAAKRIHDLHFTGNPLPVRLQPFPCTNVFKRL